MNITAIKDKVFNLSETLGTLEDYIFRLEVKEKDVEQIAKENEKKRQNLAIFQSELNKIANKQKEVSLKLEKKQKDNAIREVMLTDKKIKLSVDQEKADKTMVKLKSVISQADEIEKREFKASEQLKDIEEREKILIRERELLNGRKEILDVREKKIKAREAKLQKLYSKV